MFKHISIFITICLFSLIVSANTLLDVSRYSFHYLTTNMGLSNQKITNIVQDSIGMTWISTKAGIDRFDGTFIKNYNLLDDNDIVSYGRNSFYVKKSYYNEIWAFNSSGKVYKYDIYTDEFRLSVDIHKYFNEYFYINDIFIDINNRIWISSNNGLYAYEKEIGLRKIIDGAIFYSIFQSNQNLYICSSKNLYLINVISENIQVLLENVNCQSVYYDRRIESLWIGTFDNGLLLFDCDKRNLINTDKLKELPKLPYRSIISFNDSILLLGIDGLGVYAINNKTFDYACILNSDASKDTGLLRGNGVYVLYIDKFSNVWVGSHTGGVMYMTHREYIYNSVSYKNGNYGISDNHVNAIIEDSEGKLWYATNNGLNVQNGDKWISYLRGNVLLTLCEDNNGNIWSAGYGTGIYCVSKNTGRVKHFSSVEDPRITTDYIYSIVKDNDGNIWFGGIHGKLTKYVISKDDFEYYDIDLVNSMKIVGDKLAIATARGLYILDIYTGDYKNYFISSTDAGTKSNNFIYFLYFETPEIIWFGTDGGGLNRYDITTGKARTFYKSDGLPSNYVYGICKDKKNRIWVGTDKGLAYVDHVLDSCCITNVGFIDDSYEFNYMSFTQLKNGIFAYGSNNGVVFFNPNEYNINTNNSFLHISSFETIGGKNISLDIINKMLYDKRHIQLEYENNSFIISFVNIMYSDINTISYSYKLDGFDSEWSRLSHDLKSRYTNIPPGDYVFKVRAFDMRNKTLLAERTLRLTVAQPYWNTVYAWIIYILLFLTCVYIIWKSFTNKLKRKHFEEKISFFINTAHSIRTPISLVMAPLLDLKKEIGVPESGKYYLDTAIQNTDRLYKLVSQLLDFQKMDTTNNNKLNISEYNVNNYLKTKIEEFELLCKKKNITLRLLEDSVDVKMFFDKDKFDLLFDNLISNAYKYTPEGGYIKLRVNQKDDKVFIYVIDNGIGIPKNERKYIFTSFYRATNAINSKIVGSGIGLLLAKRIVKLHNGVIKFSDNDIQGLTFEMIFHKCDKRLKKKLENDSVVHSYNNDTFRLNNEIITADSDNNFDDTKENILILEDNDELRLYLKKMFINDYNVIDFDNGESGIEYLKTNYVDIIISDIMMPGIDGNNFCRRMRLDIRTSHIPIILLTALSERDDIIKGLTYGANDYITKPFDPNVLKLKVKNIISNKVAILKTITMNLEGGDDYVGRVKTFEIPGISELDNDFLNKCTSYIENNISNPNLNVISLCRELMMSRTLFYGKMKTLTGQAPNDFIKTIRMNKAASLLKKGMMIQDVAVSVGMVDPKYFSTVFKKYFGLSPSKFQQENIKN